MIKLTPQDVGRTVRMYNGKDTTIIKYKPENETMKWATKVGFWYAEAGEAFGAPRGYWLTCFVDDPAPKELPPGFSFLPADPKARKEVPVYSGFVKYFPRGMCAVAHLSYLATQQHHPGSPMHWDRTKSSDHTDCEMRHMIDEVLDRPVDVDGIHHKVKKAWRAMADLEIYLDKLEKDNA